MLSCLPFYFGECLKLPKQHSQKSDRLASSSTATAPRSGSLFTKEERMQWWAWMNATRYATMLNNMLEVQDMWINAILNDLNKIWKITTTRSIRVGPEYPGPDPPGEPPEETLGYCLFYLTGPEYPGPRASRPSSGECARLATFLT